MPVRSISLAVCLLAATLCAAQQIKKVPAPYTSAASGKEMYTAYCASCHGADGKGAGPAAVALKSAPTDLTQLSAHNQGAFPELKVYSVIKGDAAIPAHGSKEMPVWGPVFRAMGAGDEAQTHLRLVNLTRYLKSLQAK